MVSPLYAQASLQHDHLFHCPCFQRNDWKYAYYTPFTLAKVNRLEIAYTVWREIFTGENFREWSISEI